VVKLNGALTVWSVYNIVYKTRKNIAKPTEFL